MGKRSPAPDFAAGAGAVAFLPPAAECVLSRGAAPSAATRGGTGIDSFLNRCVCVVGLSSRSPEVLDVENREIAGKNRRTDGKECGQSEAAEEQYGFAREHDGASGDQFLLMGKAILDRCSWSAKLFSLPDQFRHVFRGSAARCAESLRPSAPPGFPVGAMPELGIGRFCSPPREAVKKFPLSQRGRRRSRPGVVLRIRETSPQRRVSQMDPPSSLGLPGSRDNPRALGAAPFFKGEFLAPAGSGHFFTASGERERDFL